MITSDFLKNCSAEESGLLHLILIETFQACGYEPSFNCVKSLRRDIVHRKLENCKAKISSENLHIVESLQKKLAEDI